MASAGPVNCCRSPGWCLFGIAACVALALGSWYIGAVDQAPQVRLFLQAGSANSTVTTQPQEIEHSATKLNAKALETTASNDADLQAAAVRRRRRTELAQQVGVGQSVGQIQTPSQPSLAAQHVDKPGESVTLYHPAHTEKLLVKLYEKVVEPGGKRKRDVNEITKFISTKVQLSRNFHWARAVAMHDFHSWMQKYGLGSPRRLLSLGPEPEHALLEIKGYINLTDPHRVYDVGSQADFAVLGAMEHLYDPLLALSNIFNVMEAGGHVFAVWPLVSFPHETPMHFYQSTAMGLAVLMQTGGFQTLEIGQWGNMKHEQLMFKNLAWPGRDDLKDLQFLQNDFLIKRTRTDLVWGLFRKPIASDVTKAMIDTGTVFAPQQGMAIRHAQHSRADLLKLWEEVVKPNVSQTRNVTKAMLDSLMNSTSKLDATTDFPRFLILLDLIDWVHEYRIQPQRLLAFAKDPELDFLHYRSIVTVVYNSAKNSTDLHCMTSSTINKPAPDMAVLGQTLEHLYDPVLAMTNMFNVLSPGALFFTSTPATNIPHLTPFHFYHYTAMGFVLLMRRVGFEVLELRQWGSLEYETTLFQRQWWPGVKYLKLSKLTPSDPGHADQVWGLFRKPRP